MSNSYRLCPVLFRTIQNKNDVCISQTEVHKHGMHIQTHTHDDSIRRNAMRCISPKNPTILTKWLPVATTVPSGTQRHPWGIGIPVYLRIFDPGPSNSTTFLRLSFFGDYRQYIESPMGVPTFNFTKKALTFTIYDCILRIRSKKVCYMTIVSPLEVEVI